MYNISIFDTSQGGDIYAVAEEAREGGGGES